MKNSSLNSSRIWKQHADHFHFTKAQKLNKTTLYNNLTEPKTRSCLQPWLATYEDSIHFLEWLRRLISKKYTGFKGSKKTIGLPGLLLTSRVVSLSVAIRRLIISGLEEEARPLIRSFIETIELWMVVLTNEQLAHKYLKASSHKRANQFWWNYVAKGKIENHLEDIALKVGMTPNQFGAWMKRRKSIISHLSVSAHSLFPSAFGSAVVPSLMFPGKLSIFPFGHINDHSPTTLILLSNVIHFYGVLIMKALTKDHLLKHFAVKQSDIRTVELQSVIVSFFTIQDLVPQIEKVEKASWNASAEKQLVSVDSKTKCNTPV